jgi:hypothetical protein
MRQFGIRTAGSEQELENTIKESISRFPNHWEFFEIGTASGLTLRSVRDIANENHDNWFVIGTDLPDGYSFSRKEFLENFDNEIQIISESEHSYNINVNHAAVFLMDAKKYLKQLSTTVKIHCAFIDADHSKIAVIEDFLAVEPFIAIGGFVMFHDAGELEQGTDPQPNGEGIGVRAALKDLGLLDNKRKGWQFVKEIHGDRAQGGWGNNTVVIQKI